MEYPFVSVVVGIRNEEKYIVECIESLLSQEYPKELYEIIIVDGMSTDNTQSIVKKYPVKLILNERKNVAAARNLGVKAAKGDFVSFTDGDCKADKLWLKTLIKEITKAPEDVACVGGPNLIFDTDPTFAKVVGYAQETFLGSGGSAQANNSSKKKFVPSLPNCNALYRKSIIKEVRCFDECFVIGQDGDLNHRIGKKGYRFLYVPEAIVLHHRRGNVKSFSIRMFKYGTWMTKLFQKHKDMVRWYAVLPASCIVFAIIALIASLKYIFFLWILGALTLIYIVLVLHSTLSVILKMKSPAALLTLLIIPLQHIMYGLGTLFNLIGGIMRV